MGNHPTSISTVTCSIPIHYYNLQNFYLFPPRLGKRGECFNLCTFGQSSLCHIVISLYPLPYQRLSKGLLSPQLPVTPSTYCLPPVAPLTHRLPSTHFPSVLCQLSATSTLPATRLASALTAVILPSTYSV